MPRLPTACLTHVPAGHHPKLWDGHAGASAQNLAEITTATLRTLLHLSCPATLQWRVHRNDQQRPRCMERAALWCHWLHEADYASVADPTDYNVAR